jgi:Flp pilus assembly protein TadG
MELVAKQRGSVLVLVVIGLVAMLGMVGLALDSGHAMLSKARLQNTVDAAALSGAKQLDLAGDTVTARAAALQTFGANGAVGGNHELGDAYSDGTIAVEVQFSATLNPFVPGTTPAEYVRVRATNFRLPVWFAGIVGATDKVVAATAVAGPSPTIDTACNIAPMMVCGDPAAGAPYWGYTPGEPDVLKSSTNSFEVGPGNFQLIRLGDNTGAADLRLALAGNYDGCASTGEPVETEPGNTVGPVVQGLNTRFGSYSGPMQGMEATYPPDVVLDQPEPALSYDSDTDTILQGVTPMLEGDDLSYNYDDYLGDVVAQNYDAFPPLGQYGRREIAIPIGDCSGTTNGQGQVPVLGFGCYFLLQEASQKGNESQVFGQFFAACNAGGVPGPAPGNAPGLYIIQLYKDPDSPEA